jgi:hypothetical protein
VQLTCDRTPNEAASSSRWSPDSQTVFKVQPLLSNRKFDLAQADRLPHTFSRRALRPFGPANLTANGDGHRPTWSVGQDAILAWTLTSELRADSDPTVILSSRADAAVLEVWDGATLKATITMSAAGPYTLTNAALIPALGSEKSFTVRAYLALGGYRSLAFDSITVTFL